MAAAGDTFHAPEQRTGGGVAPRSRRQGLHGCDRVRRGGPPGGDVAGFSSAGSPAFPFSDDHDDDDDDNGEEWRREWAERRKRGEGRVVCEIGAAVTVTVLCPPHRRQIWEEDAGGYGHGYWSGAHRSRVDQTVHLVHNEYIFPNNVLRGGGGAGAHGFGGSRV